MSAGAKIRSPKLPRLEVIDRQPAEHTGRNPILFVHGLGHGAWCWENWMELAAEAGYPAYAVSLRGHGGSEGSLKKSHLGSYVNDVIRTASTLPKQAIIVGHSLGGLVVQRTIAKYAAKAAVLVAPVGARPGVRVMAKIAGQHPGDAMKISLGGSLNLRYEYLFESLGQAEADRYLARCTGESPWAQFQVLLHKPSDPPRGGAPVMVMSTPDDNLIPASDTLYTAGRYSAEHLEFPGIGHDLMLDEGWQGPGRAMIEWLDQTLPADGQPAVAGSSA